MAAVLFPLLMPLPVRRCLIAIALVLMAPAGRASEMVSPSAALIEQLRFSFDRVNGGFSRGAKTIQPQEIRFLLLEAARGNPRAREMALTTLDAMARGGICDQVGGGFHRATHDDAWRYPFFEKSLADQALMAMAYTEAWQLTGDDEYQRVAQRTVDYVLRDLADGRGGFYAGQGTASLLPLGGRPKMIVGGVYAWSAGELKRLLGKDYDLVSFYYGVKDSGNVPPSLDSDGDLKGLNLLAAVKTDAEAEKRFALTAPRLREALDRALAKMALVRSKRPQATRDSTAPATANALTISALARAGAAFGDPHYSYAAGQGARFIQSALVDAKSGKVKHVAGGGPGNALDGAAVIQALLDAHQATLDSRWLKLAIELQQQQDAQFWDGTRSLYTTPDDSANAIAASNLVRLASITDSGPWRARAAAILATFAAPMTSTPASFADLITVARSSEIPLRTVVIIGNVGSDEARPLLREARKRFDPPRAVLVANGKGEADPLAVWTPAVAQMKIGEHVTATVCVVRSCRTPTADVAKLSAWIGSLDP